MLVPAVVVLGAVAVLVVVAALGTVEVLATPVVVRAEVVLGMVVAFGTVEIFGTADARGMVLVVVFGFGTPAVVVLVPNVDFACPNVGFGSGLLRVVRGGIALLFLTGEQCFSKLSLPTSALSGVP